MKILIFILFFVACSKNGTNENVVNPAPTPIPSPISYQEMLSRAIDNYGKEMLRVIPKDASTYSFNKYSPKEFYMLLVQEMARHESGFNTNAVFYECNKNKCFYSQCRYVADKGYCMLGGHSLDDGFVISRGLLQLSFQSALGYGCNLKLPLDLHDPEKNLICTVKILNNWITKDLYIGTDRKGGARYWSVLRESSVSRKKILDYLRYKNE